MLMSCVIQTNLEFNQTLEMFEKIGITTNHDKQSTIRKDGKSWEYAFDSGFIVGLNFYVFSSILEFNCAICS